MKLTTFLLIAFLFVTEAASAFTPKIGFTGTLEVHSVSITAGKAIFVVSGPVQVLVNTPPSGVGFPGQEITSYFDHAVIVLYWSNEEFPSIERWRKVCEDFTHLSGKRATFHSNAPQYTSQDGDFTLVTVKRLEVSTP